MTQNTNRWLIKRINIDRAPKPHHVLGCWSFHGFKHADDTSVLRIASTWPGKHADDTPVLRIASTSPGKHADDTSVLRIASTSPGKHADDASVLRIASTWPGKHADDASVLRIASTLLAKHAEDTFVFRVFCAHKREGIALGLNLALTSDHGKLSKHLEGLVITHQPTRSPSSESETYSTWQNATYAAELAAATVWNARSINTDSGENAS